MFMCFVLFCFCGGGGRVGALFLLEVEKACAQDKISIFDPKIKFSDLIINYLPFIT